MKRIIFDCDNTMGITGRPMDDALALLYLLGDPEQAEVLGITCNFGNGTANEVYQCCQHLLMEAQIKHIPLFKGAEQGEDPRCESAQFIVDTANEHPGEVSFLGLGSLTNLYGAYLIDNTIFEKLREIVLMGGITEPLFVHGQPLHELNFSINAEASACVLSQGRNITVITGNNCLPVSYLPKDEFMPKMCLTDNPAGMYIAQKCGYRFKDKQIIYGAEGSYCWDAVAAVYLVHPELFEENILHCAISEEALTAGFLAPCSNGTSAINVPSVKDRIPFQEELYRGWLSLRMDAAENSFPCKGSFLDKLTQPAILVELSKAPCHGFLLLQRLKEAGLVEETLDPAGMYRTLKRMEKAGYLTSYPDEHSAKPRRIFEVTDLGRYCLQNWETTLVRYDLRIGNLLSAIRKIHQN